jgi:hypothetical protein
MSARAPLGYRHERYARSFSEVGRPLFLEGCGGWMIERAIPGSDRRDAMGPYPLLLCDDWARLPADLDAAAGRMVALSFVTDPFASIDAAALRPALDRMHAFKEHYVVDLAAPVETFVSRHHQECAEESLRHVRVERCPDPARHLDEWVSLFAVLAARHHLRGLKAFGAAAFREQLSTPGLAMFRAVENGSVLGMQLWFVEREVGYGHLMAFSEEGYHRAVSYALTATALRCFAAEGAPRWLDLGGAASGTADDGLVFFKRGWSNDRRTVYLCGRIGDREAYAALGGGTDDYFPAYRRGELL